MLTYSSVDSSQRREGIIINSELLLSAALTGLITTNSAASASAAASSTDSEPLRDKGERTIFLEACAKLVYLVEARPEAPDTQLRPGLPIEVEPLS